MMVVVDTLGAREKYFSTLYLAPRCGAGGRHLDVKEPIVKTHFRRLFVDALGARRT